MNLVIHVLIVASSINRPFVVNYLSTPAKVSLIPRPVPFLVAHTGTFYNVRDVKARQKLNCVWEQPKVCPCIYSST